MSRWLRTWRAWGWEGRAWVVLGVTAAVMRLAGLGNRPLSYDEGVHAFFSWRLAETGWYYHSPAGHGPVLYYLDALLFVLTGASDFTARLVPALAGVALVLVPVAFRRWMGHSGALAVGFLLMSSPLLLFYSRYLRNDIYIALLSALWIWACFRYLERRAVADLYLLAVVVSLSVATKEVAFIFAAIVTSWFVYVALRFKEHRAPAVDLGVLHVTSLLPFSMPLVLVVAGFGGQLERIRSIPEAAAGCAVLGAMLATLLAWLWSRRQSAGSSLGFTLWIRLAALGWGIDALYFSTFLKNPGGLVSGFFGSVGYWLGQQPVGRGGQPWFYYLLILGLYEFLPLLLALLSVVFRLRSGPTVPGHGGAVTAARLRELFWWFSLYWLCASLIALTLAGEKMPWLAIHIVLPLCWLGGDGLARLLQTPRRLIVEGAGLLAVPALLFVAWISFLRTGMEVSSPLEQAEVQAGWLGLLIGLAVAALLLFRSWQCNRTLCRPLITGFVILGTLLWFRTAWILNVVNPESPSEPAVYAHADPDIRRLLGRLKSLDPSVVVRVTPESSFPVRWYLRSQEDVEEVESLDEAEGRAQLLITSTPAPGRGESAGTGRSASEYPYLCWPDEGYRSLSASALLGRLGVRGTLRAFWHAFYDRDYGDLPGYSSPSRRTVTLIEIEAQKEDGSPAPSGGRQ